MSHKKEIVILTNKTCIPQNESEIRKRYRRIPRTKNEGLERITHGQTINKTFPWSPKRFTPGLPGHMKGKTNKDLDQNLKFTDEKDRNFKKNVIEARKKKVTMSLISQLLSIDSIDSFKFFSGNYSKLPEWILNNRWTKDEEFGRQILNGTNPTLIERCRSLPPNFRLRNEHVAYTSCRDSSLEKELENGNIYIVNHKILEHVSTGKYRGKKIELPAAKCVYFKLQKKRSLNQSLFNLDKTLMILSGHHKMIPTIGCWLKCGSRMLTLKSIK